MSVRVELAPIAVEVDDCVAYILEVLKSKLVDNTEMYHVSVKIKCGDVESKVFTLSVRSNSELIAKLRVEVSKYKMMLYALGKEFASKVIR